ncbi:MAG: hypothetical protein WC762_10695 [Methylobacter sp.]|jgi:hypothetical protein
MPKVLLTREETANLAANHYKSNNPEIPSPYNVSYDFPLHVENILNGKSSNIDYKILIQCGLQWNLFTIDDCDSQLQSTLLEWSATP